MLRQYGEGNIDPGFEFRSGHVKKTEDHFGPENTHLVRSLINDI